MESYFFINHHFYIEAQVNNMKGHINVDSLFSKYPLIKSIYQKLIMVLIRFSTLFHLFSLVAMGPVDKDTLLDDIHYNYYDDLEQALKDDTVDPNSTNDKGWSLLHVACKLNRVECVRVLLNNSKTNVNIRGPNRITPIFIVIRRNIPNLLKLLLEHPNINVNIFNADVMTPLHYAVFKDNVECIRLLLQHPNIRTDATDQNGKTAADFAKESESEHKKEILKLMGYETNEDDNHEEEGYNVKDIGTQTEDYKKGWIDPNLDANQQDREGFSSLHRATSNGDVDQLRKLLSRPGIDVNIVSRKEGWTPLHYAASQGLTECVKVLIEHNDININASSQAQWDTDSTPLHYAASHGHTGCVKLLLQHKDININAQNQYGTTPLHYAAQNGHAECVRVLVDHKDININVQDNCKKSPLHYSVEYGKTDCVRALLNAQNIDVNLQDNQRKTSVHWAVYYGHFETLRLLLEHKDINVNIKDNDGKTPLSVAQNPYNKQHMQKIITMLKQHDATY